MRVCSCNNAMVKQRLSTADAAAEAACLRQRVLGMRLANIYDVNAKVGPPLCHSQRESSSAAWSMVLHVGLLIVAVSPCFLF